MRIKNIKNNDIYMNKVSSVIWHEDRALRDMHEQKNKHKGCVSGLLV